jgi:hypothetical protein
MFEVPFRSLFRAFDGRLPVLTKWPAERFKGALTESLFPRDAGIAVPQDCKRGKWRYK